MMVPQHLRVYLPDLNVLRAAFLIWTALGGWAAAKGAKALGGGLWTAAAQQEIHDMSEQVKTQLRRNLYLTIMSSLALGQDRGVGASGD